MKVNQDNVQSSKEQLHKLNQSLQQQVKAKESEIDKINHYYKQKTEMAQKDGEVRFLSALEANDKKIVDVANQYQEKLKVYNDDLETTRDKLEAEKANLSFQNQEAIHGVKKDFENQMLTQYEDTNSAVKDLQYNSKEEVKRLENKLQNEIKKTQNSSALTLSQINTEHAAHINQEERNFQSLEGKDQQEHFQNLENKKSEFHRLEKVVDSKNKKLIDQKERIAQDQINYIDKHNQELIIQRKNDFKTKYENLVKEHQEILTQLNTKLQQEVNSIAANQASIKKAILEKAKDPFYRIEKINPQVVEDQTHITVALPIAEHEKENVHLSARGRDLKISLTKKYSDSIEAEDGTLNKTSKSEIYTKELKVENLLNPKGITQKFEDGKVIFKIAKL